MLKAIRNSLVLLALLYIVLGVVLILFPATSLNLACLLIGAVTLLYGVVRIFGYTRAGEGEASRLELAFGIVLAALGVFLLVCPQLLVSLIPIALGAYLLVDSFSAIKRSLEWKSLGFSRWWVSFLVALVLALFGLVMILRPFTLVANLVVFIGVGFLFDGVFTLVQLIVNERAFRN
ncbi:MAG TPA: DUF308 domain-containing protein [Candidatus Acutalibacter stercorigallinarum]|nr:DUF308 domain-containing protein [Candidatus Acutalibacter stercorigallinarum]